MSIRPIVADDYPALRALCQRLNMRVIPEAEWRALLFGAMAQLPGVATPVSGWAGFRADGSAAGFLGSIPMRYRWRGQDIRAAAAHCWAVDEDSRHIALGLLSRFFRQPEIDLFLNTTANLESAKAFEAFGGHALPTGEAARGVLFWITGAAGFARAMARARGWSGAAAFGAGVAGVLAGPALKLAGVVRSQRAGEGSRGDSVAAQEILISQHRTPDARWDRLWMQVEANSGAHLLRVRDAANLRWQAQFALHDDTAQLLLAERAGAPVASALLLLRDDAQTGLRRMILADWLQADSDAVVTQRLLRAALAVSGERGAHLLEAPGLSPQRAQRFRQLAPFERAYARTPFYWKARDAALDEALRQTQAWDPTPLDGDAIF
ncbi:hypothetical protein MAIT1_03963 [Magnetofaba australis IT-1]|uniref:Uncharacterized protein n=1 Tax=Magnetofaba australis IT-1 TaxID=1434232 RepID=A0A1Y2KBD5_9PROT|nr:hypothetical protein MAIT1_03963 [Magnetofaba australis IT-1]